MTTTSDSGDRRARRRPRRPPATTTTPPRRTPATTVAAGRPAGIAGYDEVQPAVVQIVAQGTFRDPEIGFADGSGLGSGFIISPDGLAVTNNHVVAGAATLEVYVGGELDESYNATILGVSECNDLALIDINADEDLPYLEWYDGDDHRRPRRLRRRLPARRPGVHADPRHRRQGRGRRRPHRHVVDRPHRSSTTPTSSPATRAARWSAPTARSSPSTTPVAPRRPRRRSSTASPPTSPSRSSTSCSDGDFESLGINGWAVYDEDARHLRHLGRRRRPRLAGRRGRARCPATSSRR